MSSSITVALDCMGGDVGVAVVVPAAIQALRKHDDLELILVGHKAQIEKQLCALGYPNGHVRLSIRHTEQVVTMDDSPVHALRKKKNSSMRIAIDLVQQNVAAACVSAGNTGALMAISHFVLKTLPGISRCAIIAAFPTYQGGLVHLLDLGANVDSTSEHLYQFAVMGSVLISTFDNMTEPRVALLNVGIENIKGNECVKGADYLLRKSDAVNYIGYIEGDQIFSGSVDVIVCDGFVGNVTLKSCEGLVKLVVHYMKEAFKSHFFSKIIGILAKPMLRKVVYRLDTTEHNGALLGLRGIVLKSHGSADVASFVSAIENARRSAEKRLPELIEHRMAHLLEEGRLS